MVLSQNANFVTECLAPFMLLLSFLFQISTAAGLDIIKAHIFVQLGQREMRTCPEGIEDGADSSCWNKQGQVKIKGQNKLV